MKFKWLCLMAAACFIPSHIILSQFFPTDENNVLIAPEWYILLVLAVSFVLPLVIYLLETSYFLSGRFKKAKQSVEKHIADCNELNQYVESIKNTALVSNKSDCGSATYIDCSKRNMSRPELKKKVDSPNVHNCSRDICQRASQNPFVYICKYFEIPICEETLEKHEQLLNTYEAIKDGRISLFNTRKEIVANISHEIPWFIRKFCKEKLYKKLGFLKVDFNSVVYPKYIFQYVSSGGNASVRCEITMDIENLNKFVVFLSEKIKFKNSVAGQRALMTSKLRDQIKARDQYTCRYCGASVSAEPHLLLEIDHIIPVSRGGLTAEDNLQTLCWKCNRSKGAKT